jgi:hypothetical protein
MMKIKYPEIGVCGLSCRLCPNYHIQGESRCGGCKSEGRMKVGCSFITCAMKKNIEFCWQCGEQEACQKWAQHRDWGKRHDSFVCYQSLEENIASVKRQGIAAFVRDQQDRERLLRVMLGEFNEGRSKTYYCIAATVMTVEELEWAIARGREQVTAPDMKAKARSFHAILDSIARTRGRLKLRK